MKLSIAPFSAAFAVLAFATFYPGSASADTIATFQALGFLAIGLSCLHSRLRRNISGGL